MEENKHPASEEQDETSLEELFAQLDGILEKMDDPGISLENSISLYEQGVKKVKQCYEKLDLVEKKMKMIAQDGSEVPAEE